MDLTVLGTGVAAGVGLGSVYALIALSFTLIVASTGFFNFALESVVSIGGVVAYLLLVQAKLPMVVTILLVCLAGAAIGFALDFVGHRPFEGRTKDIGVAVLLATLGLSIAIDAAVGLLFGTESRLVPSYISPHPLQIFSVPVGRAYIVMFGAVLLVVIVLEAVFRWTDLGRSLRATQFDREGSALLGQNVGRTTTLVFTVSGLLAALAGFLITPVSDASSHAGASVVVAAFAALAIGGFGSFRGAIGGGLGVGLVEGVVPIYWPAYTVRPLLLAVIVATLLFRPQGLFATSAARQL